MQGKDDNQVPARSPSEPLIPDAFRLALMAEMQGAINDQRAAILRARELMGPLPPLSRWHKFKNHARYWWRESVRYRLAQKLYPFDDC